MKTSIDLGLVLVFILYRRAICDFKDRPIQREEAAMCRNQPLLPYHFRNAC